MVCVSVIKMDNLGKSIINNENVGHNKILIQLWHVKGKYRFLRKYVCPREFLYLVVMDSKEKKAWKVCNTLWSYDVMSNINSYIKKSDWRLFILFEAASNRQQQQTEANLFFNLILSIYFLLFANRHLF